VILEPERTAEFALYVRVPDWADDINVELVGADDEADYEGGYIVFRRTWTKGDVLAIDLEMAPKWIESDPRVRDNLGRVCLTNGPLVYAAERHDVGYAPQLFTADTEAEVEVRREELFGGVNVLTATGAMDIELFPDSLYSEVGSTDVAESSARLIPYYAWNNRGQTDMQVWLRRL
jgi:DUF1680 family protein